MAEGSNHKYFVALLLLIGVVCNKGDGNESPKLDMEILACRNQLLDSMINESLKLSKYVYERSADLCKKMHDADICVTETSKESVHSESEETEVAETHEMVLKHCIRHVEDRLDPTVRGSSNRVEKVLLQKYGFEDIQKIVNRKYDELFVEILRKIDEFLKGLTPEQQSGTIARNLKGWSSKIREAATLAQKEMAFRRCMRFYIFEWGV